MIRMVDPSQRSSWSLLLVVTDSSSIRRAASGNMIRLPRPVWDSSFVGSRQTIWAEKHRFSWPRQAFPHHCDSSKRPSNPSRCDNRKPFPDMEKERSNPSARLRESVHKSSPPTRKARRPVKSTCRQAGGFGGKNEPWSSIKVRWVRVPRLALASTRYNSSATCKHRLRSFVSDQNLDRAPVHTVSRVAHSVFGVCSRS